MGQPTGIVTFLMTDIVGSTPLWERSPDRMAVALDRHDELIDQAVALHGGHLLRHRGEGDSTFSVFQHPTDAIAAAVAAQRLMAAEPWPADTPIVVRMGVHSGEALIRSGEYHGRVVNRAARVRGIAEGGQVVASGATARLLDGAGVPGVAIRFMRRELLRGIDDPEEIHEVVDLVHPRAVAAHTDDDAEPASLPEVPQWLSRLVPMAFTGRDDLLTVVGAARTQGSGPRFVLLGGEPGAGKTSLAAAAAVAAHDDGWQVLAGSCEESGDVPHGPVREWLDAAVAHAPRRLLMEHVVEHGAPIGRLTRRLASRLGPLGSSDAADVDAGRRVLTDAVLDLLSRLSTVHPLVLVVDDLQWADPNTLQLLEALAANGTGDILVLATYRDGFVGDSGFGGWLDRLTRRDTVHDLTVRGFDEGELRHFVARLAGRELGTDDAELVRFVTNETGGNPFFVVELLRLLSQQDVVGRDEHGNWRVLASLDELRTNASVRAVIEERAGRLDRECIRLLEWAAIVGREFDAALLAGADGITPVAAVQRLEPARRASLVRERTDGSFEFCHALVHHTLYETLPDAQRRGGHVVVAQALVADRAGAPVPSVVASHWLRAGDRPSETAHWARLAGQAAMDQLAPEDAVRWFATALSHATDDHTRLGLMIELGRAQRWGDAASFRDTLLTAAALARRLGERDALVRAALANHRGGASRAGEVDTERVLVLEEALEAVGTADSVDRALLLATIAMERSQGDEIERSISLADEALAIARRMGDEDALFQVLLRVTEATRIPSTLDRRLLAADELFAIAERLDDPVQLGFAAVRDIRTKFEAAHFDSVNRPFQVLHAVAHYDPFVHHNHESLLAVRAQFAGDFAAALQHAEQARRLGGSEHDALAVYLSTTSMIRWDMGTMGDMLEVLDGVRRQFPGVVGFQPTAALAMVSAGRLEDARVILQDAAERHFDHLPLNPLWAMTVSVFASLCIEVGGPEAAARLFDLMAPQHGRANISVVSGNGLVHESLAGLAVVAGRLDEAAHHVEAGLAQARALRLPVAEVRLRLSDARRLSALGEASTARLVARDVADEATRLGMALVARQAREILERTSP